MVPLAPVTTTTVPDLSSAVRGSGADTGVDGTVRDRSGPRHEEDA
jgi:hypothetical protein